LQTAGILRRQMPAGLQVACVCPECFPTPIAKVKDFLQKSKQIDRKSFCYLIKESDRDCVNPYALSQ